MAQPAPATFCKPAVSFYNIHRICQDNFSNFDTSGETHYIVHVLSIVGGHQIPLYVYYHSHHIILILNKRYHLKEKKTLHPYTKHSVCILT